MEHFSTCLYSPSKTIIIKQLKLLFAKYVKKICSWWYLLCCLLFPFKSKVHRLMWTAPFTLGISGFWAKLFRWHYFLRFCCNCRTIYRAPIKTNLHHMQLVAKKKQASYNAIFPDCCAMNHSKTHTACGAIENNGTRTCILHLQCILRYRTESQQFCPRSQNGKYELRIKFNT